MARRSGKTIDFKQWNAVPGISLSIASGTNVLGGALVFSAPATILRCRGEILVTLDGATAGDNMQVGFGLGIVSSEAFDAGPGSVPGPLEFPDYSWLYWTSKMLTLEHIDVGSAELSLLSAAVRFEVDTKAMRKVKPAESLCWIVQTSGTVPVDVDIANTRVLIGT